MKRMKKIRITLFLILILTSFNIFSISIEVDSLKKSIITHDNNNEKVDLLNKLAINQIISSDFDSAIVTLDKSIELSKKLNHLIGEGIAYQFLGQATAMKGDRIKAIEYFDTSISLHEDANSPL